MPDSSDIIIVGGGIGGLTLGLMLHRGGHRVRIFEAAREIREIGAGVSMLPHATHELERLGLLSAMREIAVETADSCFFNRFGQFVHREVTGLAAGYRTPQFQIHRGDLQAILLRAFLAEAGEGAVTTGARCTGVEQTGGNATAWFAQAGGTGRFSATADAVIACDGIHSVIRAQFHPDEGGPVYSGVNMWRGVTRWKPFLTGRSYMRAGWLAHGKMVIYPVRMDLDDEGRQLINWVAEVETPEHRQQDWNKPGRLEDFIGWFDDWRWDFLDVAGMIRSTKEILEYPMVDKDMLPQWSFGRVTLLGDAAHPMYPRGSNGAGQAILDARALADALSAEASVPAALTRYDEARREVTGRIVTTNRTTPPDAILQIVYERTGDKPFDRIEDVISADEIMAITDGYKKVAGYDRAALEAKSRVA